MFYTIYQGDISTRTGELFRVFIQQYKETAPEVVGALCFPYDEPLVIERSEQELYEPIITSTATLRLLSPSDRTFLHLYSVRPATVRMIVNRKISDGNWTTYYCGTLDTDSYEEPYAYDSDYIVELAFSDFGVLKRMKYKLTGFVSLSEIIQTALQAATLTTGLVVNETTDTSFTILSQSFSLSTDNVIVSSENFYDEDNEPQTLYEALEGILQPLAWRIVVDKGIVRIFDLHSQYNQTNPPLPITWLDEDQTLAISPVYNDITITLSPYVDTSNEEGEIAFPHPTDPNINALGYQLEGLVIDEETTANTLPLTNSYQSYDYSDENRGFTIFTSKKGIGATISEDSGSKFFKIVPQGSGEEAQGIALKYATYGRDGLCGGDSPSFNDNKITGEVAIEFQFTIPPTDENLRGEKYIMRLSLPALIDYRINPFAQPVDEPSRNHIGLMDPNKETEDYWNKNFNFVYIRCRIIFEENECNHTHYYSAKPKSLEDGPVISLDETKGLWYLNEEKDTFLAYYQTVERSGQAAFNGSFTENRPPINPNTEPLAISITSADAGEYIPLPSSTVHGGTLKLQILSNNWEMAKAGEPLYKRDYEKAPSRFVRWILFKKPILELRRNRTYDSSFHTDDIETHTTINPDVEENLSIDIIFGSIPDEPIPTARGNVYTRQTLDSNESIYRIDSITRAGQSGSFQQLLAATIYSQYAEPHIRLSGTCEPIKSFFRLYTDASSPDIKFVPIASYEDVRAQTAEVTFAQLCPENYQKA